MESNSVTQRIAKLSPAKRAIFEAKLKKNGGVSAEHAITRQANRDSAPLSFAQQRLWFLHQLEPDNPSYNQPKAVRLNGALDVTSLQKALGRLVARHEVLRTTFASGESSPVQVIAESRAVEMPLIDLRGESASDREAEARRLLTETIRQPFDLSSDLMLRALLLRLADQEHVLLLVTHHIASDGSSSTILWRELASFYQAFFAKQPASLEQLPIQYADYAIWQRHWLQGEILESQLAYWKNRLAGAPPLLELSTDRPRQPVQTFRGGRKTIVLPKELTESLKTVSRNEGVTLFMTLLAAFQTLLYRYTARDDIVVGSPIAGRTRTEVEGLIGFFANTLVLRTDISGNPSFRELLARVREVALGAYAHQDLPFEKLVEELRPERKRNNSPLFQVMFGLQNEPSEKLILPGLTVTPLDIHSGTAKFDLVMSIRQDSEQLRGTLEYNLDLFDASTITRMGTHFHNVLEGIVADPYLRVAEVPLLTAAERHQFLVDWTDTSTDYSKERCIHQLFEAQVEKTPDAVALVFEEQQLTYRELNNRANQLAHYLRKRGVGADVLVGICVDRSIEMVVGLLAILKAGGAYLPIDPDLPRERIEFMLGDSQAAFLLTQTRTEELVPSFAGARISLDRDWQEIARESAANVSQEQSCTNLAYVIYTSGSTGKPKGVMIQHSNVVNFLASMAQKPGLTESDIFLAVTTLSFDIAGLEIYLPLIVGARVVLACREVAADGIRLARQLLDCGATVMQATPSTWRMLLAAGWQGGRELKILCGGEALSEDLAHQLVERCASLWNLYGPTETTIWSSVYRVPADVGRITLGRPIANTRFYVLDQHLEPVPIGVTGELHIAGDGIARGYLTCPDLTSEKFIPDPFTGDPASRLYKTGDLARYLPDGNIEFLGRIDNQVKIRGYRIELGEIEAVLTQHEAVHQTMIIAQDDGRGAKRLVAYVVPRQECDPTITELRSFVKQKLPEYMVPSTYVFLDSFPLTPNGKVDRRHLPKPDNSQVSGETFVAPRTSMETFLAGVWRELLGVDRVSLHDNFFDLGGHSLLSMKVIAQIEKKTGRLLNPRELIFGTLEQLAALCDQDPPTVYESVPERLANKLPKTFKKLLFWS